MKLYYIGVGTTSAYPSEGGTPVLTPGKDIEERGKASPRTMCGERP